jgi:hypothetical protein
LDARIAEIEKNHPAIDTVKTLTEDSKVLLTEYFNLKELRSVVEFFRYINEFFSSIPLVISKNQELAKFLKDHFNSFEFKAECFVSSEISDMHDRYMDHYAFKVLMSDIRKRQKVPSFSGNFKDYLRGYISKLEFISPILSEKYLTDTLSDLLESIAPDVIPDYKPPFPYMAKL